MKVLALHVFCLVLGSLLVGQTRASCSDLGKSCKDGVFKRDPADCQLFCQCNHKRWVRKRCVEGLFWDEKHVTCNWPDEVPECEPPKGLCKSNPCRNGGVCVPKRLSYECRCPPGFEGMDCTMEQDPCAEKPCQNGGQCRRSMSSFSCECPAGYTGNRCQDATCQRYECPRSVSLFNYPDWQDRTCRSYFSCRRGQLRSEQCQGDQIFSFMLLRCVDPSQMEIPCVLNFVDSLIS